MRTLGSHCGVCVRALYGAVLAECDWLDAAQVAALIDRGGSSGARRGRYWILDPVDGTKGETETSYPPSPTSQNPKPYTLDPKPHILNP
jgi:hypothetical protein